MDDFELYGGEDTPGVTGGRIWYIWNDGYGWASPEPGDHVNGSGAIVDLSMTPVAGSQQVMRLDYDNDDSFANINNEIKSPYGSEVNCRFDPPQDWTG